MSLAEPFEMFYLSPKAVPPVTEQEVLAATSPKWQTVEEIRAKVNAERATGIEKDLPADLVVIRLTFQAALQRALANGKLEDNKSKGHVLVVGYRLKQK